MKSWLDGKIYAVWGMGVSGIAAANLLAKRGKRVVLSDVRPEFDIQGVAPSVELAFGANMLPDGVQVLVVSPGMPPGLPIFESVPESVPVISEIDLAYDATTAPFIAITGTDGKTTTTSIIDHVLRHAGRSTVAAGNIGTPLCEVVLDEHDVIVAEVSAFQLWSAHHFRSPINVFTNIAGDHLDYFASFDAYVQAKRRMIAFATSDDAAVFNLDDPVIASWVDAFPGRAVTYGRGGDYQVEGQHLSGPHGNFDLSQTQLRGHHNALNMMAAAAACSLFGLGWADICAGLASFQPLPHRIEPVAVIGDIAFINDSKATNAHAAIAGLRAIDGDVVVITGGVDKGLDLTDFIDVLGERASAVVIIGDLRNRLGADLRARMPSLDVSDADSMEAAVRLAVDKAKPNSTVILSPAASSFDMFKSYADRGEVFRNAVRAIEG